MNQRQHKRNSDCVSFGQIHLSEQYRKIPSALETLEASEEEGILVLRRVNHSPRRRILYVNSYGMAKAWRLWKEGTYPGNHLWGCLELARKGYEILLPESIDGKGLSKRFRTDWHPAWIASHRLQKEDIIYCAHNVLLWTPIFKVLRALKCKMVGMLFAREPLLLANQYDGVIAHTPVAARHAASICPKVLCAHISWGMDLDFFQSYPYDPQWFLSCGKTFRDFPILMQAFSGLKEPATILHSQPDLLPQNFENITVESDRAIGDRIYLSLTHHYYRFARAALLTLLPDPDHRRAVGITNLLESMACGRPVLVTRTGGQMTEIDVETSGIGLYVAPGDVSSLRQAVMRIVENPNEAREMGQRGRQLCETYYNMDRFAEDLHAFFEKL